MPSKARVALDKNMKDAERLLKLHEGKGGAGPGRGYLPQALNKSVVVLLTSFLEAYCEDIAAEGLEYMVIHAKTSDALPQEVRKILPKKLMSDGNLANYRSSDAKRRARLRRHLKALREARNGELHTPKYRNIDGLFKSTIGLADVSSNWHLSARTKPDQARTKLDKFVELREEIAHRGNVKRSVEKATVVNYLELINQVAAKTGGAVNIHVAKVTGGHPLF